MCEVLRRILFIVWAGNDTIKADFVPSKGTTFPTEMKNCMHLEELKWFKEIGTFLLLEGSQIRKTNMFENTDL